MQAAANQVEQLNDAGVLLEIAYDSGNITQSYQYVLGNITGGEPAFNFFTNFIDWVYAGPSTMVIDIPSMEIIVRGSYMTPAEAITFCDEFKQ